MNVALTENIGFYRESLKTALNQIVGFNVGFDTYDLNSIFKIADRYDFQTTHPDFCFYQNEIAQTTRYT